MKRFIAISTRRALIRKLHLGFNMLLALLIVASMGVEVRADQTVTVRSGNGTVGFQDTQVRVLRYGTQGNITPTAANFVAAQTAQFAWIEPPGCSCYIFPLPSDPAARWLGTTPSFNAESALYAIPFQITDRVIFSATLDLPYSVDNAINGVFINGTRVSGNSFDGDYHSEFRLVRNDVGPLLQPNAINWLYLNVSDYGGIAGLIFRATITTQGSGTDSQDVSPNHGGNAGYVTVTITGQNFVDGPATVVLRGAGPDVIGVDPQVLDSNTIITAFSLVGVPPGLRDVIVSQGGVTSRTLSNSFNVESGGSDRLAVDIVGPSKIRAGREGTFEVIVTNDGNIDAPFVTAQASSTDVAAGALAKSQPLAAIQAQLAPLGCSLAPQNIYVPFGLQRSFQLSCTPQGASCSSLNARTDDDPPPPDCSVLEAKVQSLRDQLNSLQQRKVVLSAQLASLLSKYELRCLPAPGPQDGQFCADAALQISLLRSQIAFLVSQIRQVQVELLLAEAALKRCREGGNSSSRTSLLRLRGAAAPSPSPSASSSLSVCGVTSVDPNDKLGVTGAGQGHFIRGVLPLSYTVLFENKPTASAAAAQVAIVDVLDSALDAETLKMTSLQFGTNRIDLPEGEHSLNTLVDLRATLNLFVNVSAEVVGNTLNVKFTAIDPLTGNPPTDLRGFLPPNTVPPNGEGSVTFTIMPKQGLPTGTQIANGASIVFDTNPPMLTPIWSNTVDNDRPVSKVSPMPSTQTATNFIVQWSGTDNGSGIKDYTIYVSDNGGPFASVFTQSTSTQATFTGVGGHKYSFYSTARDLSGNIEAPKTLPDATTSIVDLTPPVINPQVLGTLGNNGWYRSSVTVNWSVTDPESGIASSSGCSSTLLTMETAGVKLTCSATNGAGLSNSSSVTIKIDKTAPAIAGLPDAGCMLWPPNHKLVQVAVVTATDALSGIVPGTFKVTGSSNEPVDRNDPQIVITPLSSGGFSIQLQADRFATGNGRVYTLSASASDAAGNLSTATATCKVPHDQGK